MQQEWKLASPPRGLLETDDSLNQCRALQPVHLISILPRSWPVHFARWSRKDKGTRNRLPSQTGSGANGTCSKLIAGAASTPFLAIRTAVYIIIFCQLLSFNIIQPGINFLTTYQTQPASPKILFLTVVIKMPNI